MKQLLVGGGLIDLATLHPLLAALAAVAVMLVVRRAVRVFGPGRQPRARRPGRDSDGDGERGVLSGLL
jgi:hypothetical protein